MKRANSGIIINRTIADEAQIEIKDIGWYVRHDTPSFGNIALVNEHILAKKTQTIRMFHGWFYQNLSIQTTIGEWR